MKKCIFCKALISIKGGYTSNLRRHLKKKHIEIFLDQKEKLRTPARSEVGDNQNVAGTDSSGESVMVLEDCSGAENTEKEMNEQPLPTLDCKNKSSEQKRLPNKTDIFKDLLPYILPRNEEPCNTDPMLQGDRDTSSTKNKHSHGTNKKAELLLTEISHNLDRIATALEKISDSMNSTNSKQPENDSVGEEKKIKKVKKTIIKRSPIWKYFTHLGKLKKKCNQCGVLISIKGGSTSNMMRHLKMKHKIVVLKQEENRQTSPQRDLDDNRNVAGDEVLCSDGSAEPKTVLEDCSVAENNEKQNKELITPAQFFEEIRLRTKQNILKKQLPSTLPKNQELDNSDQLIVEGQQDSQSNVKDIKDGSLPEVPPSSVSTQHSRESNEEAEASKEIAPKLGASTSNMKKYLRIKNIKSLLEKKEKRIKTPPRSEVEDNRNAAREEVICLDGSLEPEVVIEECSAAEKSPSLVLEEKRLRTKPNILRNRSLSVTNNHELDNGDQMVHQRQQYKSNVKDIQDRTHSKDLPPSSISMQDSQESDKQSDAMEIVSDSGGLDKDKKRKNESPIRKYFTHIGKDKQKCNFCNTLISTKGRSTSNLARHLRMKHQPEVAEQLLKRKAITRSEVKAKALKKARRNKQKLALED